MAPPKWSSNTASHATGKGKWQKTAPAPKDFCCPCLILSSCSKHNCPWAKARWPCRNCNPSCGRFTNTVAAHNAVIQDANCIHLPSSTAARFCIHMGLPPCPLIPLIINPAECRGDDNELVSTVSPRIQCHIRRDHQCQDGTQSTSSGASCEGDKVANLPNGGDTSPPTKLPAGNGLVLLQCANYCAPQTQLRPTLGRDSDASINATPLTDNQPPLAFAPSSAPLQLGTLTTIGLSNTPCMQSLTHQSTVSGAVVAGQPAANCENVDGGLTQEMVVSEMDCSGSPRAALNVGPVQQMVALVGCLGILVAAPNIGPTRLGAWLVSWLVSWLVGRLVGRSVNQPISWMVWEALRLR
jgi:hypothetical protein